MGIIDHAITEPLGGAHRDPQAAANALKQYISKTLKELKRFKTDNLLERRYEKFRRIGEFEEQIIEPTATAS